jgi:hypothetical protein
MTIDERIADALAKHRNAKQDQAELVRLQEFLQQMKEAGLLRRREYDLPLPDTLGRMSVVTRPTEQHDAD